MHDELITALRTCVDKDKDCSECPYYERCMNNTSGKFAAMVDAADAIDELDTLLDGLEADNDALCEIIEKLQKPRWVSVKERMPDAYVEVLLQFPNNQAAGFCDRDGCWGVFSGDGFYTEVADNEPKPTHWAKKLPGPPKESI